jgi:hypothetical protein
MDFEQIIAALPPNIQTILRQLYQNGNTLNARELLRLLSFLLTSAGPLYKETIWQALIHLANIGRLEVPTLIEAATLFEAGEGASVVAAGAEGAGAAAAGAAGASALALSIAALIGLLIVGAVALLAYSAESRRGIKLPPSGIPCAVKSGATGTVRKLSRSRIGSRRSRNAAVDAAQADAVATVTCGGACDAGKTCSPVAIIISAIPKYRIFWTTTDVRYMVNCACV